MERRLLVLLRRRLRALGRRRGSRRLTYTDSTIVEVYLWSVINDRTVKWACRIENWRGVRPPPGLPSESQMSRRLRSESVKRLLDRLERWVLRRRRRATLVCLVDGHAMEIAWHSADRQAGYGRARGGLGRGYKLHMLIDLNGTIWAWRVTPMNTDESEMARRMLRELPPIAYLLGDSGYDTNRLHEAVRQHDAQLVTPRKRSHRHRGIGNRPHHAGRLRSIELLEQSASSFGSAIIALRGQIEGFFGTLVSHPNGLHTLPTWIRGYQRVRRWTQAKLMLNELRKEVN